MSFILRQKFLLAVVAASTLASATETEATRPSTKLPIAKSFASNIHNVLEKRENFHRILRSMQDDLLGHTPDLSFMSRHLDEGSACDAKFISCLPSTNCIGCFETLAIEEIDWTGVTAGTSCDNVISYLASGGHCKNLRDDLFAKQTFCDAFNACVMWDDDDDMYFDDDDETYDDEIVDCSSLTTCEWEGMHSSWIGDGVCHDNINGCYNTAVCQYDGGDCCEDTCETIDDDQVYYACGHDGYACKNPASDFCNSALSLDCPHNATANGKKKVDPYDTKCDDDESKYRLVMYDSFGDGWDTTTLTISAVGDSTSRAVFQGGLVDGHEGTEYICLSKSPQCYSAETKGGTWGVEVTWEIRPLSEGSPSIAGGGAPGYCDFAVAGQVCTKTCDEKKPNIDPSKDESYKEFKDLYSCIEKKCVVQLGACDKNSECQNCFVDDAPDYCYSVPEFVAIIDCTMCSCTEKTGSEFCTNKSAPGKVVPPPIPNAKEKNSVKQCTPKETQDGTTAIMDFSSCTNLDSVSLLITDFDQNNFGQLDTFESCAHSYKDEENHGGRTALSCMQILKNAMIDPTVNDKKAAPKEAISALAANLYNHAGTFCDCSKKASVTCPLCPSFTNFKTILYESIDACQSLDAIDCDSWNEFSGPCQSNLECEFGSFKFTDKAQCTFVKNGCGGAGPFPAFRRLDCEGEIPEEAWDFYKLFSKKCLKGSDGIAPTEPPSPSSSTPKPTPKKPKPAPTSGPDPIPVPTPKVPVDMPTPKPYIPSDDDGLPYIPSAEVDETNNSRWFRRILGLSALVGIAYYLLKKRNDGFNLMRYRFRRGGLQYGMVSSYSAGESEMYGNLNSSTTFEPPSLPPTPQMTMSGQMAMGGQMTMNGP